MKIPIFTYHSSQIDGADYARNDHVALAADLRTIDAEGFRVVPVDWVVDWLLGERPDADLEHAVAITFDDGCAQDFVDQVHPTFGPQRSFFGILGDFRSELGTRSQPSVHATSFVVASPETRADFARSLSHDDWTPAEWWPDAARSDLLAIQNHSWDHNHPASTRVCQRDEVRGRFDNMETYGECDAQVRRAAEYIESRTGVWPDLFAYPWGQSSPYMREVYFPRHRAEHRSRAAFGAHDGFVEESSSIWSIPRLVFRANWSDPEAFRGLLRASASSI